MFKNKIAFRSAALSLALVATSVCAFGQIVEPAHPALLTARSQLAPAVLAPKAVIAAANVKDVDQPGRAPFQAVVSVNINNFVYTAVPIPAGQRLVIDEVSIAGAAQSASGPVQPIVLLASSVAGNASATYYIGPDPSTVLPTQFYHNEKTAIYSDTLFVGPGFAGYTPSFMTFNVVISGHLISIP